MNAKTTKPATKTRRVSAALQDATQANLIDERGGELLAETLRHLVSDHNHPYTAMAAKDELQRRKLAIRP